MVQTAYATKKPRRIWSISGVRSVSKERIMMQGVTT